MTSCLLYTSIFQEDFTAAHRGLGVLHHRLDGDGLQNAGLLVGFGVIDKVAGHQVGGQTAGDLHAGGLGLLHPVAQHLFGFGFDFHVGAELGEFKQPAVLAVFGDICTALLGVDRCV